MTNQELQHLRSLDISVSNDQMDHFLFKRVGNKANDFATSCSDSGRWMETEGFFPDWSGDWFED
jgi:hypothetical protein